MPVARRLVTESRHFFAAVTVEADLRIGDAFTISAWTKGTAQRSPSGALLRKVPANNNSLTCWSAHVEGIWRYGEHDAGLLDNAPKTAFAPANGSVVQATGWVLVTFAYARDAVRNTQHLRYYVNDELVYSASLARPVTDCVGTLLMADKDVMLGTLTFIPRALSTGQIREMLREGQALREMVVGQRPQVHVPPSPSHPPRTLCLCPTHIFFVMCQCVWSPPLMWGCVRLLAIPDGLAWSTATVYRNWACNTGRGDMLCAWIVARRNKQIIVTTKMCLALARKWDSESDTQIVWAALQSQILPPENVAVSQKS